MIPPEWVAGSGILLEGNAHQMKEDLLRWAYPPYVYSDLKRSDPCEENAGP
jgi:hypothetical protein